jgi:HemY protein
MARALTAARDPVWTADGYVSDRWLPVSPVTGRLDAFRWKVPVADIGGRALLIEAPREVASPPLGNMAPDTVAAAPPAVTAAPAPPAQRPMPRPAPIIPLQQIPDDPGPDAAAGDDLDAAVRGEKSASNSDSWQRIRQLFR